MTDSAVVLDLGSRQSYPMTTALRNGVAFNQVPIILTPLHWRQTCTTCRTCRAVPRCCAKYHVSALSYPRAAA